MNEERHQVTLSMDRALSSRFPTKCAYCLEPSPTHTLVLKNKELKGFKLVVPYCAEHSNIVNRLKVLDKTMFWGFIVSAVLLGIYLSNNQVFVIGS